MKLSETQARQHPITDFKTIPEYVNYLIQKTGRTTITRGTIHHYLIEPAEDADQNTRDKADQLDWFIWSGITMVLFNQKAMDFTPGNNYGKGGPKRSVMQF